MAKKVQVPTTKSAIMAALAEAAGISKKQAVAAYDKLLAIAYAGAKTPKGIVLPGLGKLIKAKSKARTGRQFCGLFVIYELGVPTIMGSYFLIITSIVPVLYNVNFGHSVPRCILPYGIQATVDYDNKRIFIDEPIFEE